jgi:hypothetical protein
MRQFFSVFSVLVFDPPGFGGRLIGKAPAQLRSSVLLGQVQFLGSSCQAESQELFRP